MNLTRKKTLKWDAAKKKGKGAYDILLAKHPLECSVF